MNAIVSERFHRLAGTLAELKVNIRTALATELAGAVGTAVRDIVAVAIIDRIVNMPPRTPSKPRLPCAGAWQDDEYDRVRWGEPNDPRADPDDQECDRVPARYEHERDEAAPPPLAAAMAVGLNVGRWCLARKGTVPAAVGVGVLATALGLAGGPVARAVLAVLAAANDLMTADSALARIDPS